ncbi:9-O-acetylesterase [Oscillospiraceae bacterium N12]|jgi:sialate O-acetylesterase|uniref:9-O-acetylesterase n=1 Tax=Jilunia laotingensis TaxID=2763675 RepID=A0A926F2J1_9BACT|nr:sialate O-acetylesterase [Jilunia laotingensis]MBC8592928.1 9-O-acetylesterase [Jilunia laotingensis]
MNKYKLTLLALCLALVCQAKVTLPSFFTDRMVIQQNSILTLPGHARPGRTVTAIASWNDQKFTTKAAADGSFRLEIPTPAAGGPYTLTISDGEKLTLSQILSGEVWFCSGQSNMEMPVAGWGKVMNYEQEIAAADYPSIRLLQIKKATAFSPAEDAKVNMGGWQPCSPGTIPEFSSVAYFYARALWKELNVPIGVIDCTWGGTPAEAWTSIETLKQVMGFQKETDKLKQFDYDRSKLITAYQEEMNEWQQQLSKQDTGLDNGTPCWTASEQNGKEWKTMNLPGYWEGRGLRGVDGVVWFQHSFEIPAEWTGKEITLSLAMIDDEDITYYNGKEIARGQGYATPRHYTIPAKDVKAGKGIITVRVSDFGGEGGIHGKPEEMYAEANGQKISLAGDWKYRVGVTLSDLPPAPQSPESSSYPTVLYNAMVHPLTIFPIKGVIWYQGEANVGRHEQYALLFQSLITDWRKQWKSDFPFYFVQLANYLEPVQVQPDSQWAALREAQAHALHMDNTGMAVIIDIGEAGDIHPKNKQEVGRRLSLLSLVHTYGKDYTAEAPAVKSFRISDGKLELTFDADVKIGSYSVYAGSEPAKSASDVLKGFILAGPDGVFHPAVASQRDSRTIVLTSPEIEIPIAARYDWADCPDGNLYGNNGLPVAPFRTDGK